MTLYVSRRKSFAAWLLFIAGLASIPVAGVIAATLSLHKLLPKLLLSLICAGITMLGMYALSRIYNCPRCGKCLIINGLFNWLRLKTHPICPDCLQSVKIVKER